MKASLIQRQLKLNAQVLTGLHEEYAKLRAERKKYNEKADEFAEMCYSFAQTLQFDEADEMRGKSDVNREQAALYTPYIKKFAKKIKNLEQIQKALKHELGCAQCCEAWQAEEDSFWLQQAYVAQQDEYRVTYSYDELAKMFEEE